MGQVDWQINKSTLECNKYILDNEVDCDVSFKVGDDQEVIKAHRFILRIRSPVFDRMFNGAFREAVSDPVIPDVSPAAFRMLLRYCYYDCLDIEVDAALTVPYAATKYMLPILGTAARNTVIQNMDDSNIWEILKYSTSVGDDELHAGCIKYLEGNLCHTSILDVFKYAVTTGNMELHDYCRKHFKENLSEANIVDITRYVATIKDKELHISCKSYLKEHLSAGNIWEVYKYAFDGEDIEIYKYCREYFKGHIKAVREALHSTEFSYISSEVLLDVMHINDKIPKVLDPGCSPGISVSEIELFMACNAWAEAECLRQEIDPTGANKRTVLGECLSLIRFPTMLQKDLANVVYPTGILTQAEMISVGQYIHKCPGTECLVYFPSQKRQFVVAPSGSIVGSGISTVILESEARVMLSRLWIRCPGSYTVTVKSDQPKRSWSMQLDTKHENYIGSHGVLQHIDIDPAEVLEPGTRYAVTAVCIKSGGPMKRQPNVQYIRIRENNSPYKEVKITQDDKSDNHIYSLTLSLI